jgi:hypothetical protein
MTSLTAILFTLLVGSSFLAFLYARRRGGSLRQLRGPEPSSFWLGKLHQLNALLMLDRLDDSQVTRPIFGTKMKLEIASSSGCANMVVRGVALDASV